ncbi:hypothetical protein FB645_002359 [Coemansia sp. IMI 203386]|nr:hypothetical protein FB645_002359 [Coemansia sp. IMI 203386]
MGEIGIHVEQPQLVPALVGGFVLILGHCSLITKERLFLSETLLAMVYGIVIGPSVLKWINPVEWSSNDLQLTQEFSRYCLAIEVMIAGVTLPKKYLKTEWFSLFMLLIPVMTLMWIISGSIVKFTFNMPFLQALAIGACVAPTDPVLANAILKGMFAETHVPLRLRNILTAESGANDGLGYPFLFFALYLMRIGGGSAIGTWFYATWAYQIILSIAIGAVTGYIARKTLRYAEAAGWVDKESFLLSSIMLALTLVGVCTIIGTDDILCCFVAGNSFTWDDWFRVETEDTGLQEVLNGFLSMSFFMYFGASIPWSAYTSANMLAPWRIVVTVIAIMVIRRLPIIMALYKIIPAIKNWQDALFAGWFGPIGVSAIFYAVETIKQIEEHSDSNAGRVAEIVYPIVCSIVFGSVLVHGVTIPLVLMGKRVKTGFSISAVSLRTQVTNTPLTEKLGWFSKRRQNTDKDDRGLEENQLTFVTSPQTAYISTSESIEQQPRQSSIQLATDSLPLSPSNTIGNGGRTKDT